MSAVGKGMELTGAYAGAGASVSAAIEVRDVVKAFGSFHAVDGVSLSVPAGSVFGLLGANGAGKSTLIRMLCGVLVPTSGTARVAGVNVAGDPDAVKRRIGYMSQLFSLYTDLTVGENIRLFAGIYGLFGGEQRRRAEWALHMAGLEGREHVRAGDLSGGYRQRLALSCALLHEPEVLFLDEPTSGVDPVARRGFWDLIDSLAEGGTTVLVTTHYLDEAEYCATLALMHAGRVIAEGTPQEVKAGVKSAGGPQAPSLEEVFIALTEEADGGAGDRSAGDRSGGDSGAGTGGGGSTSGEGSGGAPAGGVR